MHVNRPPAITLLLMVLHAQLGALHGAAQSANPNLSQQAFKYLETVVPGAEHGKLLTRCYPFNSEGMKSVRQASLSAMSV